MGWQQHHLYLQPGPALTSWNPSLARGQEGQLPAFSYFLYLFARPNFFRVSSQSQLSPSLPGPLSVRRPSEPSRRFRVPLVSSPKTAVSSVSLQTLSSLHLQQQQATAEIDSCAPTVQPVRLTEDSQDIFLQPDHSLFSYCRLPNIYCAHQFHSKL
jgi:hypothetical protein